MTRHPKNSKGSTSLPSELRPRFEGWTATVAWAWHDRITTWRLDREGQSRFLKVLPLGHYPSLGDERERMEWAKGRIPVPEVLDYGREDTREWMLTEALPGRDGTHFTKDPELLVPLLAEGMRMIHEADSSGCPFDFRLDAALAHIRRRLESGVFAEGYEVHDEFKHFSFPDAVSWLDEHRPDTEDVVLCHNDYCVPNIITDTLAGPGEAIITGFVDLGEMGLADRWCDLAVASWSLDWNCGPGWQPLFFETYGIEPDHERITYYRLMYDLAS
jgi:kanamycin kinase